MIGMWALALLSAMQPAEEPPISAHITVRPSIEAAITDYLGCLVRAQEQMQWGEPPRAARLRRFVEQSRRNCAQARAIARTQALRLIENDFGVPPAERQAVVDATLDEVDASDEVFLREVERRERGSTSSRSDRAQASMSIELPERGEPMQPHLLAYTNCLSQRISDRPLTRETLVAAFEAAIPHCAQVRARSVEASDEALRRVRRWSDAAQRQAAIRRTFDQADASHRSSARRLLEQMADW